MTTVRTDSFCLLSVDPGDVHCGVAKFRALAPTDPRNHTDRWSARCEWAHEYDPRTLVTLFETGLRWEWLSELFEDSDEVRADDISVYVVEEFRLYPWMAREQGYSDFKTPRLIGKLEYLAQRANRDLYLQGASIKKPAIAKARRYADDLGPGPDRPELIRLSSGRYDFFGGNQHIRDAIAHGWYWLLTNPDSPMS